MAVFKLVALIEAKTLGDVMTTILNNRGEILECQLLKKPDPVVREPARQPKAKPLPKGESNTRVLAVIQAVPGATTTRAQINEACPQLSKRAIDSALHRLRMLGSIKNVGKGQYQEAST